ncbi:MAG: hypothetical protein KatS3mg077_3011 [Candidatus Binatia bacterium]|nr:MAG: hypothetical protein KatS3mg077_3011 [Candidatus Binatia bacterium]
MSTSKASVRIGLFFFWVLAMLPVAHPARAKLSFRAAATLDVLAGPDAGPRAFAVGDLNEDQLPDIVVTSPDANQVEIFLNQGGGQFENQDSADTAEAPVAAVLGDFNRDRRVDIATANRDGNSVSVLLQGSDFVFEALDDFLDGFPVDARPVDLVAVDLDGDRILDLAVLSDASIHLLKGRGNGQFVDFSTPSVTTGAGTRGNYALRAGFFNQDNAVDLAVSSRDGNRVAVLLGRGDGTFEAPRVFNIGERPRGLATGDFGGDPNLDDIAVVNGLDVDARVTLMISDGNGGFTTGDTDFVEVDSVSLAAGDLDGDGKLDLVAANATGGIGINFLCRQPSELCFDPGPPAPPPALPDENGFQKQITGIAGNFATIVAADIDGDRKAEILALSQDGDSLRVFLNTTGGATVGDTPTPTATSETPVAVSPSPTGTPPFTPTATATPTPTPIPTAPFTVCYSGDPGQPNVAGQMVSVDIGDLNRDGSPDIVAADATGNRVVLFFTRVRAGAPTACQVLGWQNGVGEVAVPQPRVVRVGDLDGDGRADLAVAGLSGIFVFYGDGQGNFLPSEQNPVAGSGEFGSLALADVNRDGSLDLVAGKPGGSSNDLTVLVRASTNRRSYAAPCSLSVGRPSDLVVARDLDGDARVDFAVASRATADLVVFQQQPLPPVTPVINNCPPGTGGVRPLTPFSLGGPPLAMATALFDINDNIPDFAVTTGVGEGAVSIISGQRSAVGGLTYRVRQRLVIPPVGIASSANPVSVASADFNRDSLSDLVVADDNSDTVVFYLAGRDGAFGAPTLPVALGGQAPSSLAIGDIDGDGIADVVVGLLGRIGSGGVSVLVSSRPPATPTPRPSATPTLTGTPTATGSPTPTFTGTPSLTQTPTLTPTRTRSFTPLPTLTGTKTPKPGTLNLSSGGCQLGSGSGGPLGAAFWVGCLLLAALRNRHRRLGPASRSTRSTGFTHLAVTLVLVGSLVSESVHASDGFVVCDVPFAGAFVAMAQGDLNRDGAPDVVMTDGNANQILTGFVDRTRFAVGDCLGAVGRVATSSAFSPRGVDVADLDGDRSPDVVVATEAGVTVLLNDGGGNLAPAGEPIEAGNDPQVVRIADMDGDGRPDIVVGNGNDNRLTVLYRSGAGWTAGPPIDALGPVTALRVADANQDGRLDIFLLSRATGAIAVYVQNGVGEGGYPLFQQSDRRVATVAPAALAVEDFTRDGVLDALVIGGGASGAVVTLAGVWAPGASYTFGDPQSANLLDPLPQPVDLIAADWNRDGMIDAAVAGAGTAVLVFLQNDGEHLNETLVNCTDRDVSTGRCRIAAGSRLLTVGDFDGDGRPDALAAGTSGFLTALLSSQPPPTPTNTSTPTRTRTATPTSTPTPTNTFTPTETPTETPSSTPTRTRVPTSTPGPTDTPTPQCFAGGVCVSGKGCAVVRQEGGHTLAGFWLALLAVALVARKRWSGTAHGRNREV